MTYRPEIDGLRAIAVLAVIFFHAHVPGFSGGFVGVDVFFVISGFLITRVIDTELASGKFSFARFYERRLRRIVPALAVMLLATIPPALLLLSPDDLKDFFQSLLATCLCSSNVLFWKEAGYFDTQAELKPLLHTWSLSVEEQFYLCYPVIVTTLFRMPRSLLFPTLGVCAVISGYLSEYYITADRVFAFFMLPTRCWELLIGGCVAAITPTHKQTESPAKEQIADTFAIAGVALICWGIATYDHTTPFPGIHAIPPSLGTGLIILFACHGRIVKRILGHPLLVRIGVLSYSLYLWHHPLFALARHALLGEPGPLAWVGISVLTVVAAVVSWTFVEQPARSRASVSTPRFALTLVLAYGFLVAIGSFGTFFSTQLNKYRLAFLSPDTRSMIKSRGSLLADREVAINKFRSLESTEFSHDSNVRRFLVLGDSVSEDLYTAAMICHAAIPDVEVRRLQIDEECMGNMADLLTAKARHSSAPDSPCSDTAEKVLHSPLLASADVILLCANWVEYSTRSTHHGAMRLAEAFADNGRDVRIVSLFAMQEASSIAFLSATRGLSCSEANAVAFRSIHRMRISRPNHDALTISKAGVGIGYLDKYDVFVDESSGIARLYGDDGEMLFADNTHLTRAGLVYFGQQAAKRGWFR